MKQRLPVLLFFLIFLVGVFIRFYQIERIPDSLNWDEVSWGYNSYAILHTARDEYGSLMPLSFKAFGDYKQPMYIYLGVLPTFLFGLSAFAVRFPSAFFGSLSIIAVFLLTYELFRDLKYRQYISFLSMALFALSPWSIQFSRVAFEANVGIFFTITGAWILLQSLRKENRFTMILGIAVLSLSCYTYHSQKIFTPLLFAGILFYHRKYLLKKKSIGLLAIGVFLLFNIIWITDMRSTARGRSVMFTSQQTQILKTSAEKLIYDQQENDALGQVLHNRRLVYLKKYFENYLLHFDPNYLFLRGDNPRHHPPNMGILYIVSLPFILLGLIKLWKDHRDVALFLFSWLLLAPVASALAVDAPNASRSMVFLPTWQIITAVGIVSSVAVLHRHGWRALAISLIAFLYTINVIYFLHQYFAHTNTEYAAYWQYGYREAVRFTEETRNEQNVFYASDLEQPYIFYLFYAQIDPNNYIKSGGSSIRKADCFNIRNTYFGNCKEYMKAGDLVITSKESISDRNLQLVREIKYPDKNISLRVLTVQ